ncbi:MAG: alanine racemase C-terminal domain-containing protein, partial [Pseudomonadota bacterium]
VLQVRAVQAGETVGYGSTYKAAKDTVVATIGAGYGDGFLRSGGGAGSVWLRGAARPIVGRVSMDSLAVDLGPGGAGVQEGDAAELMGPNAPIDEAARRAGTISYELLTNLGSRFERRYLYNG